MPTRDPCVGHAPRVLHEQLSTDPCTCCVCLAEQEQYVGVALDAALRGLLAQFRLPGEAQKIDRIMEKASPVVGRMAADCF